MGVEPYVPTLHADTYSLIQVAMKPPERNSRSPHLLSRLTGFKEDKVLWKCYFSTYR